MSGYDLTREFPAPIEIVWSSVRKKMLDVGLPLVLRELAASARE